jgi:formylglycine-generating enzyme required for sulfatase activity
MQASLLATSIVAAAALLSVSRAKSDDGGKTPQAPVADSMVGKSPGEVRDDNALKMKLVWCPPGSVTMENVEQHTEPARGKAVKTLKTDALDDDDVDRTDEPVLPPRVIRKVTPVKAFLTRGYWIGRFEVTQAEWKQVMATEPWNGKPTAKNGDDFPVTYVNWTDAMEFCRAFTEREREAGRLPGGWEYTLPTEAQWERACRARTDTVFSFGDSAAQLDDYAWTQNNATGAGEQFAHRVGLKKPNPWGLYDMHGNVFEWCRDAYVQKLPGGRNPEATGNGPRIFRGGSWCMDGSYCRSADRAYPPQIKEYNALGVGLRVALTVDHRAK